MKKTQALITGLLLCTGLTAVKADSILGLYAGYNYWQHDLADNFESNLLNSSRSETGNIFYFALEHPVPFLPNIKVQQNEIEGKVSGTNLSIGVDGMIHQINSSNKNDISHTDVIFYYEILDNWLNLDLGMNIKYFDVSTIFYDQDKRIFHEDIDEWIPMLYLKSEIDLPFTGFSAYGSVEALGTKSTDVTDIEMGINYESSSGLGIALGYRNLEVDFVSNDIMNNKINSKAKADGFFVGVNVHF